MNHDEPWGGFTSCPNNFFLHSLLLPTYYQPPLNHNHRSTGMCPKQLTDFTSIFHHHLLDPNPTQTSWSCRMLLEAEQRWKTTTIHWRQMTTSYAIRRNKIFIIWELLSPHDSHEHLHRKQKKHMKETTTTTPSDPHLTCKNHINRFMLSVVLCFGMTGLSKALRRCGKMSKCGKIWQAQLARLH